MGSKEGFSKVADGTAPLTFELETELLQMLVAAVKAVKLGWIGSGDLYRTAHTISEMTGSTRQFPVKEFIGRQSQLAEK